MKKILPLSIFALIAVSCAEKSDPTFDKENFTAIFDNNQFSASFFPIDIEQTVDGGYLVLGERRLSNSNFRGIYLMKADQTGKFVAEVEVDEQYVNAVGDLLVAGGNYYFFCMDGLSLQAQLAQVDPESATVTISALSLGTVTDAGNLPTYPSAAGQDSDILLLLSYDHENKITVLSRYNASGVLQSKPEGFDIGAGDDVEEPIINHFIRTGRRLPFQVGSIAGGPYFFNGFVNYTFSLVFTDMSGNGPDGVVQGQQDDGGFSAVYPLGGNKFAASRFNFGDNYFLPNVTLVTNAPTIGVDLGGNTLSELVDNAPVKIVRAQLDNKNVLIFASDTRSKQIGLFFHDEATGEFLSSRYLGFSNPFEVASLTQTTDGGLAVCGTTYLAGRFPRICLIKISKAELTRQVK